MSHKIYHLPKSVIRIINDIVRENFLKGNYNVNFNIRRTGAGIHTKFNITQFEVKDMFK